ncbi:MAG: protein kinase, partial [Candidatus Krumholzibacteria bacterium]|nr:protein kinase [Candidatus Krumholzibacteria bacterium]
RPPGHPKRRIPYPYSGGTMIGKTISHYRILEKLGEGGMGVVYKAEDTKLGRTVALKFLPPELTRDPEAKERFIQEAQAASALDHPNICNIHEIDETNDGRMFIVMACYEGESLKAKIERGPLKLDEALDIAVQMARGLAKAHEQEIIHRDIKPANVFITKDGLVKIVDFGLAKLTGKTKLTKTGLTLGTAAYMSPEQARGAPMDHRTDIWSFGAILYEMLAGESPFRGEYDQSVIYSILNEEPQPVTSVRPEVPRALERVVERCLEKDPENRCDSVEELIRDMRQLEGTPAPTSAERTMQQSKELPSIAVLPFTDMSPAHDEEYFCEGIAEELINGLAQIAGLRVAARTSAFQFTDKGLDVRRVGKQLGVESVLEGSVRKAGTRLRITAQLIDVADGYHLWSEKYDRELEDIFAIQDEISLAIVEKLKGKLLREDRSKLERRFTENEEAYNLYLRGRYIYYRRYQAGMSKAIEFFQQAIEKDPLYALPYVGIADCYGQFAHWGWLDPRVAYPKAKEAVARALEIDDRLAEAHVSLGWIKEYHDWDFAAAEAEFKRALALNSNSIVAHYWYAILLAVLGRMAEAEDEARQALKLDPINLLTNWHLGVVLIFSRRYDESIEQFQKILEMDTGFSQAHLLLASSLGYCGRWDEAIAAFKKYIALVGEIPLGIGYLGWAVAGSGRREEALALLGRLNDMAKERFVPSRYRALIHMCLGERNQAFEYLNEAIEERDGWMIYAKTLPLYDSLRSDPRFALLLNKVGLAD